LAKLQLVKPGLFFETQSIHVTTTTTTTATNTTTTNSAIFGSYLSGCFPKLL